MEIKVSSCWDCVFSKDSIDSGLECSIDPIKVYDLPENNSVHQDCPLKKENITVSLEEKTTQETIDKRNHHLLTHNRKK